MWEEAPVYVSRQTLSISRKAAEQAAREQLKKGVLDPDDARALLPRVLDQIRTAGVEVLGTIESPLPGGRGNLEFLALLQTME